MFDSIIIHNQSGTASNVIWYCANRKDEKEDRDAFTVLFENNELGMV